MWYGTPFCSGKNVSARGLKMLAVVDIAEASLARGEGRVITPQSLHELAGQVKRRGRARLAAEQSDTAS